MLLIQELHTYIIIETLKVSVHMKPIRKENNKKQYPLTQSQQEHILQTEFGAKTIQELENKHLNFSEDFDMPEKVGEIVSNKSFVDFDSGLIARINNAVVKPEYRGNISYAGLHETLPNGKLEAKGISIRIDSDAYLSDIFENSPYGIIKKNRTGVGATTLELKSPRNSIVVVPTKALAYDKAIDDTKGQYKYLYVGSSMKDSIPFPRIDEYINNERILYKKIIVVADSLKKVIDAIGDGVYKTYSLMIDEVDIFQSDSTFRPALEDVIDYYFKFDEHNRCLVSATIHDFCNPKLNTEEVINIDYTHEKQRKISLIHTDNIHAILKEKIEDIYRNKPEEKIFIAYNKILYIRQVIENLSPECKAECTILCSEASEQQAQPYFKKKLDENRLPARITFATNPFFAGIDIKERFHLISVSNIDPLYTLLSPDRYLQIAGRCRHKEGVHSEAIVYNTGVYNGRLSPDSYGQYLLQLAYDIIELINQIDVVYYRYKSYELLDGSFAKEIKDDLVNRSHRCYYRIEMPLVRQSKLTKEYLPAFFNIDSLHELLKLRINIYTNPENLLNELRNGNRILSYDTQNREYTELQLRNEAIAKEEYDRIDEENIVELIEQIRDIAQTPGLFQSQLSVLHRKAKRKAKTFVESVMLLCEYIPVERLLNDLPNVYRHATRLRGYHNAAIFWALNGRHSFKRDMKLNFPIGGVFSAEQIKDRITTIYRTHFRMTITTDICVDILHEFFPTSDVYTRVDGRRQRARKIESHNINGYEGQPIKKISTNQDLKYLLQFSKK